MKKALFLSHLVFFVIVWLCIAAYTFLAILDPIIPYSLSIFGAFIIFLDLLALPLLFVWWKRGPKTIEHETWTLLIGVIILFYWGFATIHSFLTLNLNDLQLRWTAFAYIWEVVIVGALAAYAVVRIVRFARQFLEENHSSLSPAIIHARIAGLPLRAVAVYGAIVIFGYILGSVQLVLFSNLPPLEVAKNLMTGITTAALSSFFIFFLLERILESAREKSGELLARSGEKRIPLRRFTLFSKIYAISGLLALLNVSFFGTMAFRMNQRILEDQLQERILHALEIVRFTLQNKGQMPREEEIRNLFGAHGAVRLLPYASDDPGGKRVSILRDSRVEVRGVLPVSDDAYLSAAIRLGDFDEGLREFLRASVFILLMILAAIAIIGTLFARAVTIPTKKILARARDMGQGNFTEVTGVYTNDEHEDIGEALVEAAQKLHTSYIHLEEEVRRRTEQVILANVKLKEQVGELDRTAKRLVRRDFELQEANERLREIDEAKTHFVSIAAHQLRTPLSAIKWTLHMLFSGDLGSVSEEQKRILAHALESTARLITLVGDLLNVASIESGKMMYYKSTFHPKEFISNLIREISPKAKEKGLLLEQGESDESFPEAEGDKDKLMLALLSIAENAIHYTPEGGTVRIVLTKSDNARYQIKISDTGIGVPKHQQHLLFQKFFRGDNVIRRKIQGTGIALYVAQRIIEAHGGKIHVESEEYKGSVFTIILPFAGK